MRFDRMRLGSAARGSGNAGFTLIEVVLAVPVIAISLVAMADVILSTTRLQRATREQTLAYNAARGMIEQLRSETFANLYVRYNTDPKDDPGGAGAAPGGTFDVTGLASTDGNPVGRIVFPEEDAGGGAFELREDFKDAAMGMPGGLDLSGDGAIDALAHNADYTILPVRVVVRWRGPGGATEIAVNALITER